MQFTLNSDLNNIEPDPTLPYSVEKGSEEEQQVCVLGV